MCTRTIVFEAPYAPFSSLSPFTQLNFMLMLRKDKEQFQPHRQKLGPWWGIEVDSARDMDWARSLFFGTYPVAWPEVVLKLRRGLFTRCAAYDENLYPLQEKIYVHYNPFEFQHASCQTEELGELDEVGAADAPPADAPPADAPSASRPAPVPAPAAAVPMDVSPQGSPPAVAPVPASPAAAVMDVPPAATPPHAPRSRPRVLVKVENSDPVLPGNVPVPDLPADVPGPDVKVEVSAPSGAEEVISPHLLTFILSVLLNFECQFVMPSTELQVREVYSLRRRTVMRRQSCIFCR